jgi:hypothetical protein
MKTCCGKKNPDRRLHAVANIMEKLTPPAFFVGAPTMPWLVTSAAQLWASGGPLPGLVTPLCHTNFVSVALRSDYRTGFAAVSRVLAVSDALGFEPQASTARMLYGLSAGHWFAPLEDCLRNLRRGHEGLVRSGEMMYSGLSFYGSIWEAFEWGPTLDHALAEIEAGEAFTEHTGNSLVRAFIHAVRQAVHALGGRTDAPGKFDEAGFEDAAYRESVMTNPAALAQYHLMHALVAEMFGDREAMVEHVDAAGTLLPVYESSLASLWVRLLQGLALSRQVAAAQGEKRIELLAEFDRHGDWLTARAREAPANFAHLLALFDAERAAALGDNETAIRAFDRARHEAQHRQRPWHRALIAEHRGRFLLSRNMEHVGRSALREARHLYLKWGALGKVEHLEREFPFVKAHAGHPVAGVAPGDLRSAGSGAPGALAKHTIDLLAVLRTSQALSSETNLARLQERVAELLCGLIGATSAFLLLRDHEQGGWCLPTQGGCERLPVDRNTAMQVMPLLGAALRGTHPTAPAGGRRHS